MNRAVASATALTLLLLAAPRAGEAFTTLTGGKRATFVDKANPKQDTAKFNYAKDPGLASLASPICPETSTLRLVTSNSAHAEIALDCSKWKITGNGFRYSAKPGGPGGVRSISYDFGRLSVSLKDAPYSADPVGGPLTFVETRFRVGGVEYCGRFETFKKNAADRVIATGPTLPCQVQCGNGIAEAPETCDDGNTTSGDGCDANCEPTGCGNGVVTAGETCDDGNLAPGDGCRANCTVEACGDGILDPGEDCDDGNTAPGDCCGAACAFEPEGSVCNDRAGCTVGDACSAGLCSGTLLAPWINEFDYDSNDGFPNDDRDEFVEIAGPAGLDVGGYRVIAVEGRGPECSTGFFVGGGDAHFDLPLPSGTVLADDTGTGIGFLTVCFAHTSTNVSAAGKCDVVLAAPFLDSNLKNGHLTNADLFSCPDGILLLDPDDEFVDAVSYEGLVVNAGAYGAYFHIGTPYVAERDEGWLAGVSIQKTTSTLARATSASEWRDPSELGPFLCDGQIGFTCASNSRTPGAPNAGQNLACGSPCAAFLDAPDGLLD